MGAEGKENIGHLMSGRHIRMLPCDLNVLMLTKSFIGVVNNNLAFREKKKKKKKKMCTPPAGDRPFKEAHP